MKDKEELLMIAFTGRYIGDQAKRHLLNFTACMLYGSMGLYYQEHIETVSYILYGSMVLYYQEHIKTVACWLLYGSMVLHCQEHIRP